MTYQNDYGVKSDTKMYNANNLKLEQPDDICEKLNEAVACTDSDCNRVLLELENSDDTRSNRLKTLIYGHRRICKYFVIPVLVGLCVTTLLKGFGMW